jgi:aldehyde dehydrogenase (NAD+)
VHAPTSSIHALRSATPALSHIPARVEALRSTFESGHTRSYEWRKQQLQALLAMVERETPAIAEALHQDLGKPRLESWMSESNEVVASVKFMLKNLKRWLKPERVATPLALQPGKSWIQREPLGLALIIAPWNYPLLLSLNPLAGAIAAGNCVLLKPSEVAPATSSLLARIVPQYLDTSAIAVLEGGVPETTEILAQRFDTIFYTGNGIVGRIVMEAAAKHLTPVTLELGGKSPCYIDESADLEVAAKRVVWGKFMNCGQTCVAPDYLLVHERVHDRFTRMVADTVQTFFGATPEVSPDYGRIVNQRHLRRLLALLPGSGNVLVGGRADESSRFFAPTVLTDVPADAPIMRDEIFGPILPVLRVDGVEQAVRFINERPKPLALYVFAGDRAIQERVVGHTSSGGALINHVVVHLAVQGLPFGGVGPSGMGAYHGRHSFDAFSHRKAVLKKPTALDATILYPPYTASKESWLRRLM